jgi:hypothetical protein
MAAIAIQIWRRDEARAYGVQMNVPDQRQQVLIPVTDDCLISALKEVADLVVNAIEVQRVGLLQALHELGERGAGCFHQQMDVVGHQAVRIDDHPILFAIPGQTIEVSLVVTRAQEGFLTLVSPDNDMIKEPRGEHSGAACHAQESSRG